MLALSGAGSAVTTSDGSGTYHFTGLSDGFYAVNPSYGNDSFTPRQDSVQVAGQDEVAPTFVGSSAVVGVPTIGVNGPTSGLTGETLLFTATAVDCQADPAGWIWTVSGGQVQGSTQRRMTRGSSSLR